MTNDNPNTSRNENESTDDQPWEPTILLVTDVASFGKFTRLRDYLTALVPLDPDLIVKVGYHEWGRGYEETPDVVISVDTAGVLSIQAQLKQPGRSGGSRLV